MHRVDGENMAAEAGAATVRRKTRRRRLRFMAGEDTNPGGATSSESGGATARKGGFVPRGLGS